MKKLPQKFSPLNPVMLNKYESKVHQDRPFQQKYTIHACHSFQPFRQQKFKKYKKTNAMAASLQCFDKDDIQAPSTPLYGAGMQQFLLRRTRQSEAENENKPPPASAILIKG